MLKLKCLAIWRFTCMSHCMYICTWSIFPKYPKNLENLFSFDELIPLEWIVYVVWLTCERRFALFPAGNIVRDPHHTSLRYTASRTWTYAELQLRLSWMKLCSSDNYCNARLNYLITRVIIFALMVQGHDWRGHIMRSSILEKQGRMLIGW